MKIHTMNPVRLNKYTKFSQKEELAGKRLAGFIVVCLLCVVLSYFFFSRILICGNIPSSSMEPTLVIGDYVVGNGLAYMKDEPQRGDIIIFTHEGIADGDTLIKRVIGVPGDSLVFIDGEIYLNGELLREPYLLESMPTDSLKDFDEVPEGGYFVMGDNRIDSFDSRFWQEPYVKKEEIKGKMILRIPISELW